MLRQGRKRTGVAWEQQSRLAHHAPRLPVCSGATNPHRVPQLRAAKVNARRNSSSRAQPRRIIGLHFPPISAAEAAGLQRPDCGGRSSLPAASKPSRGPPGWRSYALLRSLKRKTTYTQRPRQARLGPRLVAKLQQGTVNRANFVACAATCLTLRLHTGLRSSFS